MGCISPPQIGQMEEELNAQNKRYFSKDKSLTMPHLHFSIWAVPNIDHWTSIVKVIPVRRMEAGEGGGSLTGA